jgi:hypothetical protein
VFWNRRPGYPIALGSGAGHARFDPFTDERTFTLGQGGHHGADHLALGRRGVKVLLIADRVDAETLARFQGVGQGLRRPCKSVIPPHQHHVDLTFPSHLQQCPVWGTVVPCATGLIDGVANAHEAPACRIVQEDQQLCCRILPLIDGRHAGIDRHPFLRYHSPPITSERLCGYSFILGKHLGLQRAMMPGSRHPYLGHRPRRHLCP